MYEEEKAEDKEMERQIEEMIMEHTRRELNEIASGLGLNPDDYPNKRATAAAILEAHERNKAPMEEAPLAEEVPIEYPLEEEVAKEVEKVSPDTVKGKIKAIEKKATEFDAAAQTFQQSLQKQMKENEAAVATLMSGVQKIMSSIQEQVNENEAAVAAFMPGVQKTMSGIQEQAKENVNFVKQFYG